MTPKEFLIAPPPENQKVKNTKGLRVGEVNIGGEHKSTDH